MMGAAPQHIAVFRALVLGDMLCAVPAWRALKAAWPAAQLTLVGLPWARELARRLPMIDDFIAFPGHPGLPETPPNLPAWPEFLRQMQQRHFDLLVQMHGNGRVVNPLIAACGAHHTAGFVEPGGYAPEPARFIPWPDEGHEVERLLRLVDHLGLPRRGSALEFPVTDADRDALAALWPGAGDGRPYVCVHAGAQLPSRRWPPERFAQVADTLARRGSTVVLTGTAGETTLVAQVEQAMRQPAVNLAGKTSLWTLGALIERARLLVCNDTGVSHVAAALRTPSVVISCGADVTRWAHADGTLHHVLWQPMPCRPCSFATCPYDHGCATAINAERVIAATRIVELRDTVHA